MQASFTINSAFTLQAAQAELARQWNERKWLQISFNFDKFRTIPQNSSLHLYCAHLSIAFNDAGYDMTKVLSHHADIPWDKKGINVKERVWRPVQETLCQKKSTAKLSTQECMQVYETVNRFTASRMGVSVDWPSKDNK
tara:strand:+ start:60 stop:476 length:417 start_codon:yes stop_codon:yes gene_type:complete